MTFIKTKPQLTSDVKNSFFRSFLSPRGDSISGGQKACYE